MNGISYDADDFYRVFIPWRELTTKAFPLCNYFTYLKDVTEYYPFRDEYLSDDLTKTQININIRNKPPIHNKKLIYRYL